MVKYPKITTLVTIICGFILTYSAFGAGGSHSPYASDYQLAKAEPLVKRLLLLMDTDSNGKVSKQEFMNYMGAEFDNLDTYKRGYLDTTELKKLSISNQHTGGGSK